MMLKWNNLADVTPPVNTPVMLTNGRAYCAGTLVKVKKGKKNNLEWNYRTFMLHDADRWCSMEDFEEAVGTKEVEL